MSYNCHNNCFTLLVRSGTGGGGGKPFGDGEREKWLLFGLVGAVTVIGTLAFYEMGYKEIAWKEFVNK